MEPIQKDQQTQPVDSKVNQPAAQDANKKEISPVNPVVSNIKQPVVQQVEHKSEPPIITTNKKISDTPDKNDGKEEIIKGQTAEAKITDAITPEVSASQPKEIQAIK